MLTYILLPDYPRLPYGWINYLKTITCIRHIIHYSTFVCKYTVILKTRPICLLNIIMRFFYTLLFYNSRLLCLISIIIRFLYILCHYYIVFEITTPFTCLPCESGCTGIKASAQPTTPAFLYLHTRLHILRDWYSYLWNDVPEYLEESFIFKFFQIQLALLICMV